MKVQYVLDMLKTHKNKFTVAQLENHIRADAGDKALARRTRRALFVARKAGIVLEPIRDGGKAVIAYQLQGAIPDVAATVAPARKASRAKSAKSATVTRMAKEVVAKTAKPKAAKVAAKVVASEDIKAKNLATMKAVTAKQKKSSHLDRLTAEQKAIREEFEAEEAEYARQEERAALRANAPAFLFKESYSE